MKDIKVWVDLKPPTSKGWVHVKSFFDFANLLDTVDISNMELISFGTWLECDDEQWEELTCTDCAIHLIERASGGQLPMCFNHTDNEDLQRIINHYAKSYEYNNYCGKIEA